MFQRSWSWRPFNCEQNCEQTPATRASAHARDTQEAYNTTKEGTTSCTELEQAAGKVNFFGITAKEQASELANAWPVTA